jgi:uncharacterized protein YabE (DUF348 family)/3D (Asp-Asp-Asp) domain-containing protein
MTLITLIIVISTIVISSFITVMAYTVPCTVVDGDNSYTFSIKNPDKDSMITMAVEEGMDPLGQYDKVSEIVNGSITVTRAAIVSIERGNGEFSEGQAPLGATIKDALDNAGITISENETVEPALTSVLTGDTSVKISSSRKVYISADSATKIVNVQGSQITVADVIKQAGITLGASDKTTPKLTAEVTDGMTINVYRKATISVNDGGTTSTYDVYASNVRMALREAGVKLGAEDIVSIPLGSKVTDGMSVEIKRVNYEETKETEDIDYETVYQDTADLNSGDTQVQTEGVKGTKEITYRSLYIDGQFSEKVMVDEKVTLEPVNEVVLRGTKEADTSVASSSGTTSASSTSTASSSSSSQSSGNTFVDSNGNVVSYSYVLTGSCTAYYNINNSPVTSIGMTPCYGVVAVNPNIIPYGTRMYITSNGITYGYAIAGDTGGSCMSGDILVDLFYDTYDECCAFGRRNMTVYILP